MGFAWQRCRKDHQQHTTAQQSWLHLAVYCTVMYTFVSKSMMWISLSGVNILSHDPLDPSFQQKKISWKLVHKQKSLAWIRVLWRFQRPMQISISSLWWPKYSPLPKSQHYISSKRSVICVWNSVSTCCTFASLVCHTLLVIMDMLMTSAVLKTPLLIISSSYCSQ